MVIPVSVQPSNRPFGGVHISDEKASILPARFHSVEEVKDYLENFPKQTLWQWIKSLFAGSREHEVLKSVALNQVAASEIGRGYLVQKGMFDAAKNSCLHTLRDLSEPDARAKALQSAEVDDSGLIVLKIECGNGAILRVPLFDQCFGSGQGALEPAEIRNLLELKVAGKAIGDRLQSVVEHSAEPPPFVLESIAAAYSACGEHLKAANVYQTLGDAKKTGDAFMAAGKCVEAAEFYQRARMYDLAGDAYTNAGEDGLAAECYREAGDQLRARLAFGKAGDGWLRTGDEDMEPASAARAYSKAAEAFRDAGNGIQEAMAREKEGDKYWQMNDEEKATQAYRAEGDAYSKLEADTEAGQAYESGKLYEEAARAYMRAEKYGAAGGCYEKLGQYQKAHDAYRQYAEYYRKIGEDEAAQKWFTAANYAYLQVPRSRAAPRSAQLGTTT